MQGALYFPMIRVPPSAWFTRVLLYWDSVGTIVPETWIDHPEQLGTYTRELVRSELVRQIFPGQAYHALGTRFAQYIDMLDGHEIRRRQSNFLDHNHALVHIDKFAYSEGGLELLVRRGLARRSRDSNEWLHVELQTAGEYMAALALGLCHSRSQITERNLTWVPVTDSFDAFSSLLTGLIPLGHAGGYERELDFRINGERKIGQLRTNLLQGILPVPDEPLDVGALVEFRQKYANRLPACRRHIEGLLDSVFAIQDPVMQFRALERITEQVDELVLQAETYLREANIRRISRSPLVRMLKFIPPLFTFAEAARDTAEALTSATGIESEPLAYMAFARAELGIDRVYGKLGRATVPLIEAIETE